MGKRTTLIAVKRVQEAVNQPDLFIAPPEKAVQEGLTMTRKTKLEALLAKAEAETFDRWSTSSTPFTSPQKFFIQRAYDGSLDAAEALHEAVLPEHVWLALKSGSCSVGLDCDVWQGECKSNPARAWLIAIIKALISMEPEAEKEKSDG